MKPYIIIDVDHTLSDAFWRDNMIVHFSDGQKDADWESYNSLSVNDYPIDEMVRLAITMRRAGHTLVGCTSRPDRWRGITNGWAHGVGLSFDYLLMREDEDQTTPSPMLKVANVVRFVQLVHGPGALMRDHVEMVFDDREDVCEAFRAVGVLALQVRVNARRAPPMVAAS